MDSWALAVPPAIHRVLGTARQERRLTFLVARLPPTFDGFLGGRDGLVVRLDPVACLGVALQQFRALSWGQRFGEAQCLLVVVGRLAVCPNGRGSRRGRGSVYQDGVAICGLLGVVRQVRWFSLAGAKVDQCLLVQAYLARVGDRLREREPCELVPKPDPKVLVHQHSRCHTTVEGLRLGLYQRQRGVARKDRDSL
jgi:hypothetical protein